MYLNPCNHVALTVRLTKDAELSEITRQDGNSLPKLTFTLAVDRIPKEAGTDFVRCSVIGPYAPAVAGNMVKGKLVAVVGTLRLDSGKSRLPSGDVTYRNYTTVNVLAARFLGPKGTAAESEEEGAPAGVGADRRVPRRGRARP